MEMMEMIKTRHSVRDFLPDPVPKEVLDEMLEAARLAPGYSEPTEPPIPLEEGHPLRKIEPLIPI
jgi:hypothetical protein